jgi:hypothetical protein
MPIPKGTVTASLMLRKLGSYPCQNGLAVALRELGRIERTFFILDWLQSVELRRRVHAGLNKGEACNALARAVFFNRLGEIRDRSFEQQRYRASGLNLVTRFRVPSVAGGAGYRPALGFGLMPCPALAAPGLRHPLRVDTGAFCPGTRNSGAGLWDAGGRFPGQAPFPSCFDPHPTTFLFGRP